MPDYNDGRIYSLVCNETGLEYIGSTCDTLCRRLQGHKTKYGKWKNGLENKCGSFRILEGGNYSINLVENYPCNNKKELNIRERYWYDEYKKNGSNLCNINSPYRFYADLQAQRKAHDDKRAKNPARIAQKKRLNATRYWLKKQLSYYNLFD